MQKTLSPSFAILIAALAAVLAGCGTIATAPKRIDNPETRSCDMPPPGTRILRIGSDR